MEGHDANNKEMQDIHRSLLAFSQEGQSGKIEECITKHESDVLWRKCVQSKSKDSCLHLAAREGHDKTLRWVMRY